MIYTPETLAEFQTLLTAFHEYIQTSPYFEILFSSKKGYLFLRIDSHDFLEVEEIDSPDHLFRRLIDEISSDVRDLFLCGEHISVYLFPAEMDETRKRALPYIARLPEALREHYTERMEDYFRHCNERFDK